MKRKRILSLLMSLLLVLSLTACGAKNEASDSQNPQEPAVDTPAEEQSGNRVIVDMLGREVEIPNEVQRIVPLGNATRLGVYLQVQDRFVTINQGDLSESPFMAYGWANHDAWTSLPVAASGGYGVFHPEVILEADPDVILCTYEADIVASIEEQTGIPVVAVAQGQLFGEDYIQSLRILGDVCGVPERAEAIAAFIESCLADLNARTADIADDTKPLSLGAAATFRGGHGISGVYVDFPVFDAVHARDAAAGLEHQPFDTGVEVDKEQILDWNPEILFLDAGNLGLVRTEYAEDPAYFAQIAAVQNGAVYQLPNSTDNYTNVEIPLVNAYYVGSILYPDAFADVDFEAKAAEIFEFFLGRPDYLNVLKEAGLGYQPVSLEE